MLNLYMPLDLYLRSMATTVTKPKLQKIAAARQERAALTLSGLTPQQRTVKRAMDIVLTSIILVMALPIMAIVALAIKLDSPGPILFKQRRVGEGGKLFHVYKFRSMVVNAEALQVQVNKTDEHGNVIHKSKHDPRITRVGRIIRKLSLDEFPQFFNVL
ncbi:MAG: sugar transferase, partial [Anaerolineae bacterium]|nr:sugar transferase [Anaerolineae bacterium]